MQAASRSTSWAANKTLVWKLILGFCVRQALAKGGYGHHQAIIYGNHVKELQELGEIVGFEVEVFH